MLPSHHCWFNNYRYLIQSKKYTIKKAGLLTGFFYFFLRPSNSQLASAWRLV
jgi:hypothetical protein